MASSSDSLVGRKLGPYRIETLLASGAMGNVFRGIHEELLRPVAIKTLKDTVAADRELLERFFAEARAVNLIRHENIVECTDMVSEEDGRTYMVMELLEGRTLGQAIREHHGLSSARAVGIAVQIADAIGAAHDKGIVHRDLKPENVFLIRRGGNDDYVKILDFGIARLRPEIGGIDATQSGALIGTPTYMSPEQVDGQRVGPASDIYTLGVLLFQMLAGKVPFDATSSLQIMMAHLSEKPPRVDTVANVSPALADLVERTLAKKIEDRPRSMAELRAELEWTMASAGASRPTRRRLETFGTEPTDPMAEPTSEDEAPLPDVSPSAKIRAIGTDPTSWAHTATRDMSAVDDVSVVSDAGDSSAAGAASAAGEEDAATFSPAADTIPRERARRASLLALALFLVVGAVIAVLVVRGVRKKNNAAPAPSTAEANDPDAGEASTERRAFDELLRDGHHEPLAPPDCRTVESDTIAALAEAADLLRDGAPGGARPEDRHAMFILTGLVTPTRHAAEYWHLLAKARLYAGEEPAEVIAAANSALKQCDRYAAPHLVAGTAAFRADRIEEAEDSYGRALAIAPDFAAAHFNIGLVQLADERLQPAIESFSWVIDRDARNADALIARGQAYLMARKADLASRDLERAVDMQPARGDAHLLLGLAYDKSGKTEAAQRAFCKARDLGVARGTELCKP